MDASAEETLGAGQPANLGAEEIHQLVLAVWTAVRKAPLEMIPHSLVGVEFGSVGRKRDQMKTSRAGEELLDRLASVDVAVVQKDEDVAPNLSEELPEEVSRFGPLDIVFVEMAVEGAVKTPGADGDARDGRYPVVTVAIPEAGCLADGAPGLSDGGDQQEARLVDEDDVGTQPRGVFFTFGHTSRLHRSISSSSRSRARRSGFWWLQPSS